MESDGGGGGGGGGGKGQQLGAPKRVGGGTLLRGKEV